MIKRSSSRTSRSRGIKGKHVLQICLLIGICFWLVYQVKHSHEKKKEFDEKSERVSSRAQTHDEILKLGRKDLHPRERDSALSGKYVEEEEDETGAEEEVNKEEEKQKGQFKPEEEATKNEEEEREEEEVTKNEEEETEEEEENTHDEEERDKLDEKDREEENEEESKGEEAEGERGGDGDDGNGEKNKEKIRGETDGEEDSENWMNERELDGEEKEVVDKEGEDKIGEVEHETLMEEQEQNDSGKNSHEAREEHYKADDASSAVTHEPEKETSENLIEKMTSELEQENNSTSNNPVHSNNSTSQLLGQRLIGNAPPVTDSELKDSEAIVSNSEDKLPNATFTALTSNQPEQTNKSTEVSVDAGNNATVGSVETTSGSSQQNDTVTFSHLNQAENATIDGATTGEVHNLQANDLEQVKNGMISDSNQANPGISINTTSTIPSKTESNNTIDGDTSKSSSNNVISDKTSKPEITAEAQINSGSVSTTEEVKDDSHNENSNTDNESGGTDESSGNSTTDGTGDSVTHDPIDSSDSSLGQEEREARIDLSTLPETSTDVINSGNVEAE